jgi:2-polyprenyl-3-methyl-5-hydroxy-6-metoxy-1,4-benzoquinol methylase
LKREHLLSVRKKYRLSEKDEIIFIMERNKERIMKFLSGALQSTPPVVPYSLYKDSQTQWLISKIAGSESPLSLLDYGCGNCRLLNAIISDSNRFKKLDYYAMDIVKPRSIGEDALSNDRHIAWEYITSEQLGKYSAHFDYVVLMNVIHEVSIINFARIIEDTRQALKPEGFLLLVDMSLLPEGEPKSLPFHPWEIEYLFLKSKDYSFYSKSKIPLVAMEIPMDGIPVFSEFLPALTALVKEKRDIYSSIACSLSEPSLRSSHKNLLEKLSLNKCKEYDLAHLMLLSGHANWRLMEEAQRVNATYDEVALAAISILKLFVNTFEKRGEYITIFDAFKALGAEHRYESLNEALFCMIQSSTRNGLVPAFFFPPTERKNLGMHELEPTEVLDAFYEYYNYNDIGKLGLRQIQCFCHEKMWPSL